MTKKKDDRETIVIVWLGRGGELDRRIVPPGVNLTAELMDMVGHGTLDAGDTIMFVHPADLEQS